MFATDVVKYRFGGSGASVGHVIKPLADSLFRIRTRGDVEQPLAGFGVLHNGRSLPLHSKRHGTLGFLQLLHKVARTAAEGRPTNRGICFSLKANSNLYNLVSTLFSLKTCQVILSLNFLGHT